MVYDFCVIGGGIVGLATSLKLLESCPGARLILLEKEAQVARHQTGHNSGVIHAGIYYAPDSLKARLCREGLAATKAFCRSEDIPFIECGKLIVATNDIEASRVDTLYDRARLNGVALERLDGTELATREPAVTGVSALLCPETAIVDYTVVAQKLAQRVSALGGEILFDVRVDRVTEAGAWVEIGCGSSLWRARRLVGCAGLQADRLAKMAGIDLDFRIVPFRGEYFQLPPSKSRIVNHLIYPAPDPDLPFLGIHLTRMIDGSITVGPNAVVGFSREGYRKGSFNFGDTLDFVAFRGFWKVLATNRRNVLHEIRGSLSRRIYLAECRKYCSSLELTDLRPYRAGIRAQAVMNDGSLANDFLFRETPRMLHVCNAPSPAATSALPIGRMIAERVLAAT